MIFKRQRKKFIVCPFLIICRNALVTEVAVVFSSARFCNVPSPVNWQSIFKFSRLYIGCYSCSGRSFINELITLPLLLYFVHLDSRSCRQIRLELDFAVLLDPKSISKSWFASCKSGCPHPRWDQLDKWFVPVLVNCTQLDMKKRIMTPEALFDFSY